MFTCETCTKGFSRIDNLTKHKKKFHNSDTSCYKEKCPHCELDFTKYYLKNHVIKCREKREQLHPLSSSNMKQHCHLSIHFIVRY